MEKREEQGASPDGDRATGLRPQPASQSSLSSVPSAFELVNPSDAITFEAESFEAAACATLLVGGGKYAAKPVSGDGERVPIFLLGGFDQWFGTRFSGFRDMDELLDAYAASTARCLRSFLIGNRGDFEAGAAHAPDREAFRHEWNVRKRTSMNDIVGRANDIAQAIEARRAETGTGSVHESAVGNADAPQSDPHHG